MNEGLYKIISLLIPLICVILTYYVVPYVKTAIGDEKLSIIYSFVDTFVKSAEMIFGEKSGEQKLKYVTTLIKSKLESMNVKMSEDEIRALIEKAVYTLKNTKEE